MYLVFYKVGSFFIRFVNESQQITSQSREKQAELRSFRSMTVFAD